MRETQITTGHGHDFDGLMRDVAKSVTGWDVDHSTHTIAPSGEHFVTVFGSRKIPPPPMPPVREVPPPREPGRGKTHPAM